MPPPGTAGRPTRAEVAAREEKRRQQLKLLAEIERRINEENARPKKRYISPSTREEVFAIYYDGLRRKIEDKGTTQFPGGWRASKLYGELTMRSPSTFDGQILDTESWSGHPATRRWTAARKPSHEPPAPSARS